MTVDRIDVMLVSGSTVCGDQSHEERLLRAGSRKKSRLLSHEFLRILRADHVFSIIKFEFTQIDAIVRAIDDEIDLRLVVVPLRYPGGDAANAKLLDRKSVV